MLYIRLLAIFALLLMGQFARAGAYEEMIDAVKKDDTHTIASLLKRGFDASSSDQEGNTMLILAAKEGSQKAAKQLVAARAKVNTRNVLGETAVMLAALYGHVEIVRDLVVHGAEINSPGWPPLI